MLKPKLLVAGLALLVLGGCMSIPHECPLGEECVGVADVYEAAIANEGTQDSVLNTDTRAKSSSDPEAVKDVIEQWRPYSGGSLTDKPVYQPPKPIRIWVAPWRGDDGILRSGEYLYVTSPGHWHYGDLRSEGAGAGILRPSFGEHDVRPSQLPVSSQDRVQPHMHFGPEAQ